MNISRLPSFAAALLISAGAGMAQTSGDTTTTPPADKPAHAGHPNEHASDNAKAVHTLLDQFRAQRADFIAARQALIEKLKTATDDERKAILEELRDSQKARVEEQRALGKEIRDEVKKLRETKKGGG